MSIALILTVAAAIFVIAIMDARTRRLAFRIEHLHQMRSDDTSARLALNEKVNQLVDDLSVEVANGYTALTSEIRALWVEVANMGDTMRSSRGGGADMTTAKELQSLYAKDIAFLTEGYYDEAAKLSRAEQSIEILETRMGRVETDAKWRYSDFDVDGRTRLLSPYEIVVSLQSKLEELERKFKNLVGVGSASLTIHNAPEQPQPRVVEIKDPAPLWSPETGEASIVPQDMIDKARERVPQNEPMSPEELAEWQAAEVAENGAPENWTEQRITAMERAYDTTASQVALSELERKVKALRTEILGGPLGDSGIPTPGALSELRQQVEGINTNLGHRVERATKLNKAAIQLVAQSAARTEVRTILRKRKGFWRTTLGNMWGWMLSPIK